MHPYVHACRHPSIHSCTHAACMHACIHSSISMYAFIRPSVRLAIHLYICLFAHLQCRQCFLKAVYTCDCLHNFCRTFQCNFCRTRARDKNCKCKLAEISVRFVAAIWQRFPTCSKLDATWHRFGGNCSKLIALKWQRNLLLVYTCD